MNYDVIIPVYNCEEYLERCIRSILDQTHGDFRIIAVDDGSTDNSLLILQRLQKQDNRITVIPCVNRGVSYARNIGLGESRGDVVVFVDSDDYVDSGYLEYLDRMFIKYDADVIVTREILTTEDEWDYSEEIRTHAFVNNELVGSEDMRERIIYDGGISGKVNNKAYRIKNISLPIFNESLSIGEDMLFNAELFNENDCNVLLSNQSFYHYLLREGSITQNKCAILNKNGGLQSLEALRQMAKFYNYNDGKKLWLAQKYFLMTRGIIIAENFNNEIKTEYRKYLKNNRINYYFKGRRSFMERINTIAIEFKIKRRKYLK